MNTPRPTDAFEMPEDGPLAKRERDRKGEKEKKKDSRLSPLSGTLDLSVL